MLEEAFSRIHWVQRRSPPGVAWDALSTNKLESRSFSASIGEEPASRCRNHEPRTALAWQATLEIVLWLTVMVAEALASLA